MLVAFTGSTQAQTTGTRKKQFNTNKSGLALNGYAPVAYFAANKTTEGKKTTSLVFEDITYRFASEQNKTLFKATPGKYEPQYGDWCAYVMGTNDEKKETGPETFKVFDGKLYLFYNSFLLIRLKAGIKTRHA